MAGLSEHVVIQANCLFDAVTAHDNLNRLPDGFLTKRELQDILNAICLYCILCTTILINK